MNQGHEIAMGLRAAYWTMHRRADAELLRLGVTADQFVLLSILADGDGITQQELGRKASSDPNTVRAAMLVLLEARDMIARKPHPTDGRARSVFLTAKGRRTYEQLWSNSHAFRERLAGLFDRQEAEELLDKLNRIAESTFDTLARSASEGERTRKSSATSH